MLRRAASPPEYPAQMRIPILTEFSTVKAPTHNIATLTVDEILFLKSRCINPKRPTKVVADRMLEHPGVMVATTESPNFETSPNWVPCQVTGMPARFVSPAARNVENRARGSQKKYWRIAGEPTRAIDKRTYGSMILRVAGLIKREVPYVAKIRVTADNSSEPSEN